MLSSIVAALLLVLTSPLLIVVASVILILDGRPILFRQKRIGKSDEVFVLLKFRTMRVMEGANLGEADLVRTSKFGAMLRRTSIDEIPSLVNILSGDMVFVGPRPLPEEYLEEIRKRCPLRSRVKPGLTGLAQVKGRNDTTWRRRFRYDRFYVMHKSNMLNLKIIFETFILLTKSIFHRRLSPKVFPPLSKCVDHNEINN